MIAQKHEPISQPNNGYDKRSDSVTLPDISVGLTQEQRKQMIAETAYYIAERRYFQGGDPVQDWLLSQMVIDSNTMVPID